MNNAVVVLGVVLTAVGGGGGLASLVLVRRQSRKLRVDAAQVLSSAAVTLVAPLEQRLTAAELRATEAERALDAVRVEVIQLRAAVRTLHRAILSPGASVEWLRTLVARQPLP